MAFPASRASSGALNSQAASTIEAYTEKVHDIVRKEMLAIQMADAFGFYKVKSTSHHRIDNVVESEDSQATAFNGFDTLPNGAPKGSQGVYWDYKNYAAPVAWALTDSKDMSNPFTVVDQLEVRTYKAMVGCGKLIDRDMVVGNTSDAKKINGLEQMIFPIAALTPTTVLSAPKWRFRQATNTFGGVTRVAFTGDGVAGTNWENVSTGMRSATETELTTTTYANNNRFGYQTTATVPGTVPTAAYQLFEHVYLMCTYGIERPNLILSTTLPYEDYSRMGVPLVRYSKTNADVQSLNLGFGDVTYKGAEWGFSENFAASGLNGTPTAGQDMIYLLNTNTLELEVTDGCDFVATDWVPGQAQLASTMYIYWRGQFVCVDPRKNGVLWAYGT